MLTLQPDFALLKSQAIREKHGTGRGHCDNTDKENVYPHVSRPNGAVHEICVNEEDYTDNDKSLRIAQRQTDRRLSAYALFLAHRHKTLSINTLQAQRT